MVVGGRARPRRGKARGSRGCAACGHAACGHSQGGQEGGCMAVQVGAWLVAVQGGLARGRAWCAAAGCHMRSGHRACALPHGSVLQPPWPLSTLCPVVTHSPPAHVMPHPGAAPCGTWLWPEGAPCTVAAPHATPYDHVPPSLCSCMSCPSTRPAPHPGATPCATQLASTPHTVATHRSMPPQPHATPHVSHPTVCLAPYPRATPCIMCLQLAGTPHTVAMPHSHMPTPPHAPVHHTLPHTLYHTLGPLHMPCST